MAAERTATDRTHRRVVAAVAPAALIPLLGSLIYFVGFAGQTWARWTYVLVKLFTLVWPLLATVWILRQSIPNVDWRAPRHRRALPAGAVVGTAVVVAVLLLMKAGLGDVLLSFAPQIRHKVDQLGVLDYYLTFALFLAVAHSGLEEYYWRWFVFGNLRTVLGLPAALSIASLTFASHHLVILSQYVSTPWAILGAVAVVCGGAVWCLMYERQKTLTGAWLSHILSDLAILWVGYQMLF